MQNPERHGLYYPDLAKLLSSDGRGQDPPSEPKPASGGGRGRGRGRGGAKAKASASDGTHKTVMAVPNLAEAENFN